MILFFELDKQYQDKRGLTLKNPETVFKVTETDMKTFKTTIVFDKFSTDTLRKYCDYLDNPETMPSL